MTRLMKYFSEGRTSGKHTLPFVVILLGVTILASAANLFLPADSALYVSTYTITLLGKYLCYAMLALAVDIILGLLRYFELRSRGIFRLRRLRHGHVFNASNR